jgi:predicted cupin superfamily sugar epimerase
MSLTPERIAELLGLSPHITCGLFRETFRSPVVVAEANLPAGYVGTRVLGGTLYFMVTPQAPVKLHRIRSDQMYHYYLGDPLEVLLLYPDRSGAVKTVGPDLASGMRPQLIVPGGTFHAARVASGGHGFSLLGTSVWLRAEPADVEAGDAATLKAAFPDLAHDIDRFTTSSPEI